MNENARLLELNRELCDSLELALDRLDTNRTDDLFVYEKALAAITKAKGAR